jgi:hypothetical protein
VLDLEVDLFSTLHTPTHNIHVEASSLDGLGVKESLRPESVVFVTATLLCKLASSFESAQRLASKSFSERYHYMKLGSLRAQALADLVLSLEYKFPLELTRKGGDPAFHHWITYLTELLDQDVELVHWGDPLLGCLAGHVYGVGSGGIVAVNSTVSPPDSGRQEMILCFKSGAKPIGVQSYKRWVNGSREDKYPANGFARDILQIHLQAHAREAERGLLLEQFPPTILKLVYGNPHGDAVDVYTIPDM